ncbi:magnesium protoporphyrin IX methyltransferase [Hyphomonas sp.]|uniref:magnesium protoporphyrin IX methyltransferase n=1 Tax=Hyphomonas sp. TaxID=87 RepID=UPI0039194481
MDTAYQTRRAELQTYFDETASVTWQKLTSTAPVSGIRATVRAGREAMHSQVLSWLPGDMTGLRVLDAGCGTGTFAVEAARRGAEVVAIDIARSLVETAAERLLDPELRSRITWRVGDMTRLDLGEFDHMVAMDSIIHYDAPDMAAMVARILPRIRRSAIFTYAPRTPLLTAMHAAGKLFPRSDRAPAIVPVSGSHLMQLLSGHAGADWNTGRQHRVNSTFYISEAREVIRK